MTIPMIGLILAGGLSRRMGGEDKAVMTIGGQTFVQRALERLRGQVDSVLLNSNHSHGQFDSLGIEIRPDCLGGFIGPLAGILTGLEWARAKAGANAMVLSVAVDCPLFPLDLGMRLADAGLASGHRCVIARSGGRAHPVFGVWSVQMAEELRTYLTTTTNRKMMDWVITHNPVWVDWPTVPHDPFMNINTPDELRTLASDETLGLNF